MARIIKANSIPPGGAGEAGVMNLADIAAEARAVILDARKDAARVVSEARAMADTVCDQAAEKGYAEGFARGQNDGYADGHKQGMAEAKDELADRAEGLIDLTEKVIRELSTARAELLHRGRCEMLDFALDLAAKIVGRVAARDAGAARENLRKALELADCAGALREGESLATGRPAGVGAEVHRGSRAHRRGQAGRRRRGLAGRGEALQPPGRD